jgi:hypothetical protein
MSARLETKLLKTSTSSVESQKAVVGLGKRGFLESKLPSFTETEPCPKTPSSPRLKRQKIHF